MHNEGSANETNQEYDPYEYRDNEKCDASVLATFGHIIKGSFGTGLLAMPLAFSYAGLAVGAISTILLGSICTYTILLLVRTSYKLCKREKIPYLTYEQAMNVALENGPKCLKKYAKFFRALVTIFLLANQIGICCVYVAFVASNMKDIFDEYVRVWKLRTHISIYIWPIFLLFLIKDINFLSHFSHFFNLVTLIGLGGTMYYVFRDEITFDDKYVVIAPVIKYPMFIGICLFSLEAIGVILIMEGKMKKPGDFRKVFTTAMVIILSMYCSLGFLGYLKYGNKVKGAITLNLPFNEVFASIIRIFFTISMLYSYSLQGYVPVHIILNEFLLTGKETRIQYLCLEYTVRFCIIAVTYITAFVVPDVGALASLVGALTLSTLGFIFPALIEFCSRWPNNYGKYNYIIYRDLFLFIFGIFAFIIGTGTTLVEIYEKE